MVFALGLGVGPDPFRFGRLDGVLSLNNVALISPGEIQRYTGSPADAEGAFSSGVSFSFSPDSIRQMLPIIAPRLATY